MEKTKPNCFPRLAAVTGGLIVFATLAFLNLDGYHNEPYGPGDLLGEPPDINWTHGWPFVGVGRSSVGTGPLVVANVQMTITSRWPFDDTPIHYVYPGYLCADIAILVTAVVATVWSINELLKQSMKQLSYGMKFLFVAMTLVAAAMLTRSYWMDRIIQYRFAIIVLVLAAACVVCGIANVLVRTAHRSMPARRA